MLPSMSKSFGGSVKRIHTTVPGPGVLAEAGYTWPNKNGWEGSVWNLSWKWLDEAIKNSWLPCLYLRTSMTSLNIPKISHNPSLKNQSIENNRKTIEKTGNHMCSIRTPWAPKASPFFTSAPRSTPSASASKSAQSRPAATCRSTSLWHRCRPERRSSRTERSRSQLANRNGTNWFGTEAKTGSTGLVPVFGWLKLWYINVIHVWSSLEFAEKNWGVSPSPIWRQTISDVNVVEPSWTPVCCFYHHIYCRLSPPSLRLLAFVGPKLQGLRRLRSCGCWWNVRSTKEVVWGHIISHHIVSYIIQHMSDIIYHMYSYVVYPSSGSYAGKFALRQPNKKSPCLAGKPYRNIWKRWENQIARLDYQKLPAKIAGSSCHARFFSQREIGKLNQQI